MKQFYNYKDRIIIYHGDTLDMMAWLMKHGIIFDAIMADLPFGFTGLIWDSIIPMNDYIKQDKKRLTRDKFLLYNYHLGIPESEALTLWTSEHIKGLWYYYKVLIKETGPIVLNCSQPFTSHLVESDKDMFKYEYIWNKVVSGNFQLANYQPLKVHESILVFGKAAAVFTKAGNPLTYNPQMTKTPKENIRPKQDSEQRTGIMRIRSMRRINKTPEGLNYPKTIITVNRHSKECNPALTRYHPNQKPLKLLRGLLRTHTSPDDIVLDNTAGSFTTAVACILENRRFIGIEQDEGYCKVGRERIIEALMARGESSAAEGVVTSKSYQIGFNF